MYPMVYWLWVNYLLNKISAKTEVDNKSVK